MEDFGHRINILVRLMGVFETAKDFKLLSGHIVYLRRNPTSEQHGAGHCQVFENEDSNEVIGHVSGLLGTTNSDNNDCDILSELIDCHSVINSVHHCSLSLMLVENTTHRVTGSQMVARLSCKLKDVNFFVDFLRSFNKTFELV